MKMGSIRRLPALALGLLIFAGCTSDDLKGKVIARQITQRSDLIGGPSALGEVGDYLLANEKIRVIIQGPGYSRGFGIYGGSLIDADLQRARTAGDSGGGRGFDTFAELFPAIFLKAMKPRADGVRATPAADDGSASIVVSGGGDEFLYIAKTVDDVLITSDKLVFQNEYKLSPGKRYVEITTNVTNQTDNEITLPGPGLPLNGLRLPLGDVILFGAGNQVFSEQAGFDLRFTLEKLYVNAPKFPKLPGIVTPFLATRSQHVSYGFMSGITDPNLSFVASAGYEGANVSDILVPFLASSFTGAYYGAAPPVLYGRASRDGPSSFSFKKYFIIGTGDVASIRDVYHEIRGTKVGKFAGIVREQRSEVPEVGVSVITFDSKGSPYDQHTTDDQGGFHGTYAPGDYTYRVVADGRFTSPATAFTVKEGQSTFAEIRLVPPGLVGIRITSEDGKLMPARCSLVGQFPEASIGFDPKDFLFSFKFGEAQRATMCPTCGGFEGMDPNTREFVEQVIIAATGSATEKVRPGKYRAVCSRGMEYEIVQKDIEVKPSQLVQVDVMLKRAINTQGWVSGDYHLHSINSVDSFIALDRRIGHVAAEGVDIACSTDHNYVTDYTPSIQRLGIEQWIQGIVGLELTTLEIGHFNGFPLRYDPGPITKGSFVETQKTDLLGNPLRWQGQPPANLMRDLRSLGSHGPNSTIVQVNHPRDTILGYFNDYHLNPDIAEVEPSDALLEPKGPEFVMDSDGRFLKERFAKDFDALEVFNGKRFDLLRTYRVPAVLPPPPLPMGAESLVPGTVLRDKNGRVAFPGAMEDWFSFLNNGVIYTATGNSDSHGVVEEPGIPRTYTPVSGSDRPGAIDELEVVDALKNQRALATNGPFILANAQGAGNCHARRSPNRDLGRAQCGMGEVVSTANGQVMLNVTIQVAPWIQIDTVKLIRGGEIIKTLHGDRSSLATIIEPIAATRDTWVVVEVTGTQQMWPVIAPLEIPPVQISDAINAIGSGLGINFKPFGNLAPKMTYVNHAEGFTNPIFIDADGDGQYTAPGISQHALRIANELPRVQARKFEAGELPVLVRMFGAFAAHGH